MTTRQQIENALRNADKAGDEQAARRLAQALQQGEYEDAPSGGQQPQRPDMNQVRQQAMQETAADVGPLEAFMIGTGKGFMDIGRGIGLADEATESEKQAMGALSEERPYTTMAGEITGQSAPFAPLGVGVGAVRSIGGRALAGGALGAAEGGVIARGTDRDVLEGAGVGAGIGAGAEILFPVLGRMGRSVYRRVKGSTPEGAMLDAAGRPTAELQGALDEAGMSFEDLTVDAQRVLREAKPGSDPQQMARAAQFAEEGVPMTRGELTQDFTQRATEERLMKSAMDPNAAPFREFREKQSEAIRRSLEEGVNLERTPEETGDLIKDALMGRKNLLRTQKNELYTEALEAADNAGNLPIMADVDSAIPDARTIRGLNRASGGAASDVMDTLSEYSLVPPTERLQNLKDFEPTSLTLQNAEEVNQILKGIARQDQSGAVQPMVNRITGAIDEEVANLAENAKGMNLSDEVVKPLRQARQVVTEMKREFDPKSLTGQLVDVKRGGNEPAIYGSKVYDKLVSRAAPVEGVRSTVENLKRAGPQGQQAIGDLQATTMLDLLEAGFGTKSRKIEGVPVFNPNAFQRRMEKIGKDKLDSIFSTNPSTLQRLRNIDKISTDLIPPADTVPKGSAPVLMDIMQRLGAAGITSKVPGAGLFFDKMGEIAQNYGTRQQVRQAMKADPDIAQVAYRLDREFPGIVSALGIAGISQEQEENDDNTN